MPDSRKKNMQIPNLIRIVNGSAAGVDPELPKHWDASDLAKAATDVIALNRQPTASSDRASNESGENRAPRVSSLSSLRCGLKIRREDEGKTAAHTDAAKDAEKPSAPIRSLVKE